MKATQNAGRDGDSSSPGKLLPGRGGGKSWPESELAESRLHEIAEILRSMARRYALDLSGGRIQALDDQLAETLARPLTVMVVGPFSSGKSSLINALFGRDLFEVGLPETTRDTNVVVVSDQEDALVPEALRPEKGLVQVVSHETLPPGTLVVDTPGFNSRLEAHDRIAARALLEADVVLACGDVQQGPSRSMLEFLRAHERLGGRRVLVLTKSDLLSGEDLRTQVASVETLARENGFDRVLVTSVKKDGGMEALRSFLLEEIAPEASRIRRGRIRSELADMALSLQDLLAGLLDGLDMDDAEMDRVIDKLKAERSRLRKDLNERRIQVLRSLRDAARDLTREIRLFGQTRASEMSRGIAVGNLTSREFFRAMEEEVVTCSDRFGEILAKEVGEHFHIPGQSIEADPVFVERIRAIVEALLMVAAAVVLPLGGLGNVLEALAGRVLATIMERSGTVASWVQGELERSAETLAVSFLDNCDRAIRDLDSRMEDLLVEHFLPELKEKESALEDLRDQRRRQVLDAAERRRTITADRKVLGRIAGEP